MKIFMIILAFLSFNINTFASSNNIKGYNDKNSNYVSKCNDKYYGYHKKNGKNHWHEVKFKDGKWNVLNHSEELVSNPCNNNEKQNVTFIKCVDGDTAVFKLKGVDLRFRFLAVDTPESVHPTKEVQVYGKEASEYTCNILSNANKIEVEYDVNSDKTDKYNRDLAWIWVDDILLQNVMISEGYAKVSYVYGQYKYVDDLCSLQKKAIEEKKGLWQYYDEVGYCDTIKASTSNLLSNVDVYTVIFENGDEVTKVKLAQGMKVKKIIPKEKKGFIFKGWYLGDKKYDFDQVIKQDIKLTAKYSISWYYVAALIIVLIGLISGKSGKRNGKSRKKSIKFN